MLKGIIQALIDDSDVNSIASEIAPNKAPQGANFPYVVCSVASITPDDDKDGPSDMDLVRVQVDAYDEVYGTAYNLADKCRRALERLAATKNNVVIGGIQFLDQTDLLVKGAGDTGVNMISMDYKVRVART